MFFCAPKTTSSILSTKRVKFSPGTNPESSTFAPDFKKEKPYKKKELKKN